MNCVDCGGLFVPGEGSGRPRIRCYSCSPAQRKSSPRKPHEYAHARAALCAWCSRQFTARLPFERYCSRRCGTAARNRAKMEAARDRSARHCKVCGVLFAPAYGDFRTRLCSKACAKRQHSARTTGKAHIRRAQRFGCAVERINKLKVFERDMWKCRICGIEAPRSAMGTGQHNAPELDHVVPLSRGGAHSYSNTQLACRSCNRFKRDMTVEEMLQRLAA